MKIKITSALLFATNLVALSASAGIAVQTKDMDGVATGQNYRRMAILLTNTGPDTVQLEDLVVKYNIKAYSKPPVADIWYYNVRAPDWSWQGGAVSDVKTSFLSIRAYGSLVFKFKAQVLPANWKVEIQFGIHNVDWSVINENLDPSYQLSTNYVDNVKVPASTCVDCMPEEVFDIHFVIVSDDANHYGSNGRPIGWAELQTEVDNLNRKFITETGHNLVSFRLKSFVHAKDNHYLYNNPSKIADQACISLLECQTRYQYANPATGVVYPNAYYELEPTSCPGDPTPACGGSTGVDTKDCDGNGVLGRNDCLSITENHCSDAQIGQWVSACQASITGVPIIDHHAFNVMIRSGFGGNNNCYFTPLNTVGDTWYPYVSLSYQRMPFDSGVAAAYFEHEVGHAFGLGHVRTCAMPTANLANVDTNIMEGNTKDCSELNPGTFEKNINYTRNTGFYVGAPVRIPQDLPNVDDYAVPYIDALAGGATSQTQRILYAAPMIRTRLNAGN